MSNPTYNADDLQVWKPQPGEFYKYGLAQRESYGGIVAAIQDVKEKIACGVPKAYPSSFAGIIAALEDLAQCIETEGNIDVGPKPPNWEIIIDIDGSIDGNWITEPKDGNLWFDTRQGRLFIAVDGEYWQTNGGDGLAYVDDNVPKQSPVIGSTWFDTYNKLLYVWSDVGRWEAVNGADSTAQTTASLPLAFKERMFDPAHMGNAEILPPDFPSPENFPEALPELDVTTMNVQANFNEWLLWASVSLGQAIEESSPIYIGETPPVGTLEDPLKAGTLWYDTEALELSIWYEDDDSGQWVPTSTAYSYDEDIAALDTKLANETRLREQGLHHVQELIDALHNVDPARIEEVKTELNALKDQVEDLPEVDLSPYLRASTYYNFLNPLLERMHALETASPDYATLMSRDEIEEELDALQASIAGFVTTNELQAVVNQIPDVSSYVTQQNIDSSIENITTEYLPRTGGTVDGSFVIQKTDYSAPAFDFSSATWNSSNAFQFKTNGPGATTAQFGTNDNPWEYAWDFSSEEDFCWVYNNANKVFSITKEGPACSTLYLGDFQPNNNNGRVISNKIDVKERLNAYQSAFEQMRQGVNTATDFDSLKANILSALANV